jgi:hypothetical protein
MPRRNRSDAAVNKPRPIKKMRRRPQRSAARTATDEQSAEHQRVRGEDPLLTGLGELQRRPNRRQCHGDDGQVKYHHELGDTDNRHCQPTFVLLPVKLLMLETYPAVSQLCNW